MKKIAVVTATRAEYGLLSPLIRQLRTYEDDFFHAELIVTGTHLSEEYGSTIHEIESDRIRIDEIVKASVASETGLDISKNQADVLVKFTRLFLQKKYEAVILLGDRYEMLAVAIAAGNTHTPVFHLCGGDTTEGAIDEWIRHSITKISYLHFVTNKESCRRVVRLGESPDRVFNYGSTSIDNIMNCADMSKAEALESVEMGECKYALCTYHPVTMDDGDVDWRISNFLQAIEAFPDIEFIVTKANADQGGSHINDLLDKASGEMKNIHVFYSLGLNRYLSLMKYAEFVLGNSSSGIIEAPAFKVPTINIGDRQRGRLQAESIINCGEDSKDIVSAIKKAVSTEFRAISRRAVNPYGDGHAAEQIAAKIIEVIQTEKIDLKKKFYEEEQI